MALIYFSSQSTRQYHESWWWSNSIPNIEINWQTSFARLELCMNAFLRQHIYALVLPNSNGIWVSTVGSMLKCNKMLNSTALIVIRANREPETKTLYEWVNLIKQSAYVMSCETDQCNFWVHCRMREMCPELYSSCFYRWIVPGRISLVLANNLDRDEWPKLESKRLDPFQWGISRLRHHRTRSHDCTNDR